MALLSVHNLKMAFGERVLFADASFEIGDKDRVGLVGANGSGKTTLFKLIIGEHELSEGMVTKGKHIKLGYMQQHVGSGGEKSLYDDMLCVFDYLVEMEAELEGLAHAIDQNPADINQLIDRQHRLSEEFEREGGLTFRSRARSALIGLGFSEADFNLSVKKLSGGQVSKLNLGKLLLGRCDLLLLDEPTNHLDIKSVEWLEEFLRTYSGAAIIISHDRYFLDRITTATMEIENEKIKYWKGNYSDFIKHKKEQEAIIEKQYADSIAEVHRIEGIIEQQRRWNRQRNIIMAESKQKMLDKKLEQIVKPEAERENLRFKFKPKFRSGNDVLKAEALSKSFGKHELFKNASFDIKRGERVFLIGPNGCGKTTLLRILTGEDEADSGAFNFGAKVKFGYFDQRLEGLNLSKTVLDDLWEDYKEMGTTQIRSALASFLFKGEEVNKRVKSLSGGERARLALLKLMLSGANLLLLDEPTNHLDIASRETLEEALEDFEGSLFVVSHDRYFINKLASRVIYMQADSLVEYQGNYDYYLEKSQEKTQMFEERKPEAKAPNDYQKRKERESRIRRLKGAIARLEERLESLDAEAESLNAELLKPDISADYEKVMDITNRLSSLEAEQEEILHQWEENHEDLKKIEETSEI